MLILSVCCAAGFYWFETQRALAQMHSRRCFSILLMGNIAEGDAEKLMRKNIAYRIRMRPVKKACAGFTGSKWLGTRYEHEFKVLLHMQNP